MPEADDNISTKIEESYAAFASGDLSTGLSGVDPRVEWIEAAGSPYGGTFHGPDEVVRNIFEPLGTDWSQFSATPTEIIVKGATAIVLGDYAGVCAQTGKRFTARFTHVWRMREGLVHRFEQIADTHTMRQAMS